MVNVRNIGKAAAYTIVTFAAVGIGLGLSGYLSVGAAEQQLIGDGDGSGFAGAFVALILLQSAYTMFLLGPVVASTAGLITGLVSSDTTSSLFGGGVGTLVGFYVMVLLGVVIMSMGADLGGGGGMGDGGGGILEGIFQPLITAGIPTTVVGVLMGYVGTKIGE